MRLYSTLGESQVTRSSNSVAGVPLAVMMRDTKMASPLIFASSSLLAAVLGFFGGVAEAGVLAFKAP